MSGIGPHKISDDRRQLRRLGSCKSNYHTITTTTTRKLSNQYSWQEHVYNSCNQQGGAGMSLWVDNLYFHIWDWGCLKKHLMTIFPLYFNGIFCRLLIWDGACLKKRLTTICLLYYVYKKSITAKRSQRVQVLW
jgi:hypothetical protein